VQRRTPIILGIDAGTTSVKTVAFTTTGSIVGVARSSVHVHRGPRGEAEADMEHIWDATATTISAVAEGLDQAETEVVAIGLTGQGDGAWLVDQQGLPVLPAALWLDGRATARLNEWLPDGRAAAVHNATGSPLFPGALPLLIDAIREEHPDEFARAAHQLNCKDWLRFKLTGQIATDPSEASRTYLDTATGAYADELFGALDQTHVRELLPPVKAPDTIAGPLDTHVATTLGLPAGIPVAVGLVDTAAAGVGIGAEGNGDGYCILGTTGFVGVNHPSAAGVRTETSIVLATGRGTQVLESLAPMTGTPNLDWIRDCLGMGDRDWVEVEQEATAVPAGSNGVIYLPYGSPSGERAPFFDSAASASWLGMSVTTSPGELLRSVYEGLAFSLTECLDDLHLTGSLAICGGGSDSDLLCQILADVSGRDIKRQNEPEVGARGSAILAGIAAAVFPDLATATGHMTPASSVFTPDPSRHAIYADFYRVFIHVRDALRPSWPALRALRNGTTPVLAAPAEPAYQPLVSTPHH